MDVHQLDAALDDVRAGLVEPRGDVPEQLRVHLVLGVHHADDIAGRLAQGRVQRLGLVLRHAVVDHDPDQVGVPGGCLPGHQFGAQVVVTDDRQDLEVVVLGLRQPVQGVAEHVLLVPGRHHQGEADRPSRRLLQAEARRQQVLGRAPGVQHPRDGGEGDGGEREGDR